MDQTEVITAESRAVALAQGEPPPYPAVTDSESAEDARRRGEDWVLAFLLSLRLTAAWNAGRMDEVRTARLSDTITAVGEERMRALASGLVKGTLSEAQWFERSKAVIVKAGMAQGFAALGTTEPTPSQMLDIVNEVNRQAGFLDRMRSDIEAGKQLLDGTLLARAEQYARAGHAVVQNVLRGQAHRDGYTLERRNLGHAHHCQTCIDQADLGWQPVGTLNPIGDSECGGNCHCEFEYQKDYRVLQKR